MSNKTNRAHFDAVAIGAGFSGLYMLQRLRDEQITYEAAWAEGGYAFIGSFSDITRVRVRASDVVDVDRQAAAEWVAHVAELGDQTLLMLADSWHGANIPGKPRVFLTYSGGMATYREHCTQIAADGYPGFAMNESSEPRLGRRRYP